jgi:8-oxo-dGTP diphosphatase
MSTYTYDYPMPSLTADVVAVSYRTLPGAQRPTPHVLLILRGSEPFKGMWALPGGFVNPQERTEDGAVRELKEETGIVRPYLSPDALIGVFSAPGRDPRGWVVSAGYALVVEADEVAVAGDDALSAQWVPVPSLEGMEFAFDHREIIEAGLRHFGLAFPG